MTHRREPRVLLVHLPRPHVAVDVGRYTYTGVAKYPPHHFQLRPAPQHLRGVEVPHPVRRERLHASPHARPLERLLYIENPDLPRLAVRIKTILKDGREYNKEVFYPRGHARNPLTEDVLVNKFMKCIHYSAYHLDETVVDPLINAILNLEQVDDIVTSLLVPLTPK